MGGYDLGLGILLGAHQVGVGECSGGIVVLEFMHGCVCVSLLDTRVSCCMEPKSRRRSTCRR